MHETSNPKPSGDPRPMHSLLQRQLRRFLGGDAAIPEALRPLIEAIDTAYRQSDQDRLMLERSLDLSSQELLLANREMRAVVQLLPDLFFRLAADGTVLDCNAASPALLDQSPRAVIGRRLQDLGLGEPGALYERAAADVRRSGQRAVINYERPGAGGACSYEATLVPMHSGEITVFVRDVTERVRGEEERRRLAAAVEQAAEAILITDTGGRVTYVNPAFERITGYRRAEVLGQNPRLLKSGLHDGAFYQDMWAALLKGEVWHGRMTDRRKDGSTVEFETTISPIRDRAGALVQFVSVSHDVSRELELEERLRQAQKMEAIGRLAGGIAHDFNNLLTAMLGNSEIVLRHLPASSPAREDVEDIRTAANKAAGLVGQLLAFSRKQVLHPQVLDLNQVVGGMTRMLQRVIGAPVELVTELGPDVGPVRADPIQVEQVVMNLAVNARDAMPQGGRLHMSTSRAVVDDLLSRRYGDLRPGIYAALTVSDTGVGMTPEVQAHLFEPFFTTKDVGKGTGLGLATVYGIVTQSGGHVSVYSEPGAGTTVTILLPVSSDALPTPGGNPPPPATGGGETVLVVEDEAPVRKLAARLLGQAGYRVLDAPNGSVALDLLARHGGAISVMLTDVVMPGLLGTQLAQEARRRHPALRVLFMSGHPEKAISSVGCPVDPAAFIQKPFTGDVLARKVREALARPSSSSDAVPAPGAA